MKLVIKQSDDNDVKTTRTFSGIADNAADATLKAFALAYIGLTESVSNEAQKVITTELDLS